MSALAPEAKTITSFGRTRRRLPFSADIAVSAGILGLLVLACFAGPAVLRIPGPNAGALTGAYLRPGAAGHLLGTDNLGNDLLSRALFGGRTSLEVAVGCILIGVIVGGVLGVVSGYRGGLVDTVVMRFLDMLLAFPSLILALCIATYLGPKEQNVIFAIAFFSVPANARIIRSATLKIRDSNFVAAARFSGRSERSIMLRHIVPNVLPPLMTFALLGVAIVILVESSLSFLGAGIPLPQPSWGNMISTGEPYLSSDPWLVLVPAAFLFLTVLNLNLLGDALRSRWEV